MHGLLAEFASAEGLLHAARRSFAAGYRVIDAYAPFPVDGLAEAIGRPQHATPAPLDGLLGKRANGTAWLPAAPGFPWMLWGWPIPGWTAFLPPPLRLGMQCAMLATVSLIGLQGLRPRPPLTLDPQLPADAHDHFFLCIHGRDPKFDPEATPAFLGKLAPQRLLEGPE